MKLLSIDDLAAEFPEAVIESVGERKELVIYTGWSVMDDGRVVPMDDEG